MNGCVENFQPKFPTHYLLSAYFCRPLASEGPRRYERQSQWDSGSSKTISLLSCKLYSIFG